MPAPVEDGAADSELGRHDSVGADGFPFPTRMLPMIQDYHNRKGLISNRGQRKLAFYELQRFYRKAD
jgi:hypothetical protein